MSICPKNKSSKSRRDKRRANWKMSAPTLVKCSKCGALMMPHRVCKACGSYNKREIVKVEYTFCGHSIVMNNRRANKRASGIFREPHFFA